MTAMTAVGAGLGFVAGQLLFCWLISMGDPKPYDYTARNEESARQGALFIDQIVTGEFRLADGVDVAACLDERFRGDPTFFGVAAHRRLHEYLALSVTS